MKIGEVARAADCTVETVRFYEREELLPDPARTGSNYRIYGEKHVERLLFIRYCRSLDMTLDEIRVLLHFMDAPSENCGEVNALLDEHIGHVALRIRELRKLETQLKNLRRLCKEEQDALHCGILNELTQHAYSAQSKDRHAELVHDRHAEHVHGAHAVARSKPVKKNAGGKI